MLQLLIIKYFESVEWGNENDHFALLTKQAYKEVGIIYTVLWGL